MVFADTMPVYTFTDCKWTRDLFSLALLISSNFGYMVNNGPIVFLGFL